MFNGQTVNRVIPRNVREVLNVLHLISPYNTDDVYSIVELQIIANNIDLDDRGTKAELAYRIRDYIFDYFNLP